MNKIELAEREVARLSQEKEKLEDLMADPEFYNGGHNIAATQKTYDQVLKDLAEQEETWLQAQAS